MIHTKHRAVKSLKPNSEWSWGSYDYADLQWHSSDTKPTEAEINTEHTRLNNAEPLKLLREERNTRLAATDWRASSDLTLPDAWKTYRQALRDLPANTTDPRSPSWPTQPS